MTGSESSLRPWRRDAVERSVVKKKAVEVFILSF